ncbi:MAG: hypothetical protein CSA65_04810 [Proteobacteria bacterium]|nr:MAG: hypothetical protein CSA65_04810 [Pseudomonadota bacterium]
MSTPSRLSRTLRPLLTVAAILAPAGVLAVLGLRAYSAEALLLRQRYERDQVGLVRLVGKRLSDEARRALVDLAARCQRRDPDGELESRFVTTHPLARHIFLVRGGQLVYPPAKAAPDIGHSAPPRGVPQGYLQTPGDLKRQYARRQRRIRRWQQLRGALSAEYRGKRRRALATYRKLAQTRAPSDEVPAALLGVARLRRQGKAREKAREAFRELRRRFGGRRDPEGIDYALIADVGLAELGDIDKLVGLHRRLAARRYKLRESVRSFYLRWVVRLLRRRASKSVLERVSRDTQRLFIAERFGRRLSRFGVAELSLQARAEVRSVALGQQMMLVLQRHGDAVVGFALAEGMLRRRLAEQQRDLITSSEGMRLGLQRVGAVDAAAAAPAPFYSAPLPAPLNYWILSARRPPDALLARERRGELRQLAVVVGLLVLMASGLFFTYRGVRRESDLARLKSDFVSTVSHELKTPLTSIRMFAEMLQQGIADTSAARERYQWVIIRESERLGQLITNVLDFSRVERGTRRYDLQGEPLEALVREAVETFQRLSDGEEVRILFAPPPDLPLVYADREAAVTSLLNLLSNAAKYSRERPDLKVRFVDDAETRQRGEVGVAVVDQGIGIPAAEQKRIFDDFYRAPGARAAGVEGTGLGLSLVRRHMEACGGRVTVESRPGEGSTFTLLFRLGEE